MFLVVAILLGMPGAIVAPVVIFVPMGVLGAPWLSARLVRSPDPSRRAIAVTRMTLVWRGVAVLFLVLSLLDSVTRP